jgi:predicted secreted hydrolase
MKPRAIQFPDDVQPHDTVIEWWYFNGYLMDEKGNQYAFMDCLFRANVDKVKIPYFKNLFARTKSGRFALFAHSMLADLGAGKSAKDVQNISLASRDSFKRPQFYANYIDPVSVAGGFVAHEMAETSPGTFHIKTETLDLVLESKREPMLEGGEGFITVRGRESFYYSLTDLKTTGMIRTGAEGAWSSVTGRSWMDHQWADTPYAKDKWTWFSIQLDGGIDIMCVEYDDGKGKDQIVDMLDARGTATHLRYATFSPGSETWKSKATKAEYPLSWTITIPGKDIVLRASAMIAEQEMIFGSINYWEGPITITGTIGGKKMKGVGFMELAGYPSDYNFLFLAGKKVNRKLQEELAARIKNFLG